MPEGFFVYVLRSERTARRYVGSTADVDDRLRRHNAGHSKSTKHGTPWMLIYSESFGSRAEEKQREMFLKSGQGRVWLDELLG